MNKNKKDKTNDLNAHRGKADSQGDMRRPDAPARLEASENIPASQAGKSAHRPMIDRHR